MKVYKILHKPTGLYFTPSRGTGNLSVRGKLYPMMPLKKWFEGSVRIVIRPWNDDKICKKHKLLIDHFKLTPNSNGRYFIDKCFDVPDSDWEIVEI